MGAVVVGPWKGATKPRLEHDDDRADCFRRWAEYIEKALEQSDQPLIPMRRRDLELLAENHRSWEHARLKSLELQRLRDGERQLRRPERGDAERELAHRMVEKLVKLEAQVRRARRGTQLDTLGLDPKTHGHLWSAGIATLEELRKHTERPDWHVKGIGPMRREEIIAALREGSPD